MTLLMTCLGWLLSAFIFVLMVSMALTGNWAPLAVLLVLLLLVLPPVSEMMKDRLHWRLHWPVKAAVVVLLLMLSGRMALGGKRTSIYSTPQIKARFYELYDEKMADWPLPFDDVYLDSEYGRIHVLVSGNAEGPPLLLLHASGVSSWSWKYNAAVWGEHFRLYAVDLIGDAGKSEYADLGHVMKSGQDQARLYSHIMDELGIDKACVAGASEGGFIATNLALYAPERVERVALLGPMGYSGAMQAIVRITLAQLFPLKPVQDATFAWAFSSHPATQAEYGEWFPLLMSGTFPMKVAPMPVSAELRQSISVPMFFVFGMRDNLVGDPQKAAALVQDIPDVRTAVVNAGHLMGGEVPMEINTLVLEFLAKAETASPQ